MTPVTSQGSSIALPVLPPQEHFDGERIAFSRGTGGTGRWGACLVFLFLAEALLAKGSYPGVCIPFSLHMIVTVGFLIVFSVAGFFAPSINQPERPITPARRTVLFWSGLLVVWGCIACCFTTKFTAGNWLFWGVWALNYWVAFNAMPRFLAPCSIGVYVFVFLMALLPGLLGSLLFPAPPLHDRFVGVYANPTWTGLFLASSVLLFSYLAIASAKLSSSTAAFLICCISVWALLLTRTRAAIASAILSVCVMLIVAARHSEVRVRRRAGTFLFRGGMILAGVAFASACDLFPVPWEGIKYVLRLESGAEALYVSRGAQWEAGWENFWKAGLTGEGFLSKYSDTDTTQEIAGIALPRYDWTTTEDPLNSVLLIGQQIGIPGALAFIGLLFALGKASLLAPVAIRPLAVGFFCVGLVTAFLNGNWLLSFGDSFDRFSFVFLSCVLAASSRAEAVSDAGSQESETGQQT